MWYLLKIKSRSKSVVNTSATSNGNWTRTSRSSFRANIMILRNFFGVQNTALHHFELPARQRGPWRVLFQRWFFSFARPERDSLVRCTSSVVDGKLISFSTLFYCFVKDFLFFSCSGAPGFFKVFIWKLVNVLDTWPTQSVESCAIIHNIYIIFDFYNLILFIPHSILSYSSTLSYSMLPHPHCPTPFY